ncbi:MAG: YncE family protein [bacterium]|nr:YncE family protein [bacterium]
MPEKALLLVLNKHEDTMSFVDPDTYDVLTTIDVGHNPHELILTPDRRYAYASNYAAPGNTISVIDVAARKHICQVSTGAIARIHGAAMAPDGKHAYFTAGQSGYVVEVDVATNRVTRGIPTQGKISHMVLVSADGKRLYTANIVTEDVSVIDRATGDLITKVPCGPGCEGMAFTPDGQWLWAANQEAGTITRIDLKSHTAVETFPCPGMPVRLVFAPDGSRAYVSSWTENGELVAIDMESRQELKRIAVGSQAIGLALDPVGRRAFVGCEHTDGVHVVDLESLEVAHVFHTGDGSDAIAWWDPPARIEAKERD